LFNDLQGSVLELRAAQGDNFSQYPKDVTLSWKGFDSNPAHIHHLKENAAIQGFPPGTIEVLESGNILEVLSKQPSASVDNIVSHKALCRAEDPKAVLEQVQRVLRPLGRFYYIEVTGRERGSLMRGIQTIATPFIKPFSEEFVLSNDAAQAIFESQGFASVTMEQWPSSGVDLHNPRAEIRQITYQLPPKESKTADSSSTLNLDPSKSSSGTIASRIESADSKQGQSGTVVGLKGFKPLIAGVAIKKRQQYSMETLSVNPLGYGMRRSVLTSG
jgi:SAM-dependent methyltransferase